MAGIPLAVIKKATTFALNHYIREGDVNFDAKRIYFYAPDGGLIAWVRRDATNGRNKGSYWVLSGKEC